MNVQREVTTSDLGGSEKILEQLRGGFFNGYIQAAAILETPLRWLVFPAGSNRLTLSKELETISFNLSKLFHGGSWEKQAMEQLRKPYYPVLTAGVLAQLPNEASQLIRKYGLAEAREPSFGVEMANGKEAMHMARQDCLPQLRRRYGQDSGLGEIADNRPDNQINRFYLETAPDMRIMLRELAEQGTVDAPAMNELAKAAEALVRPAYHWTSDTEWTDDGDLPLLYVLSGDLNGDLGLSHFRWSEAVAYNTKGEKKVHIPGSYGVIEYPPDESQAVNIQTALTMLSGQTSRIMEVAGWQEPENWFRPCLKMLEVVFKAVGEKENNWRFKQHQAKDVLRSFLAFTISGGLLRQTEAMMLYAAAETRFYAAMVKAGVPVCEKIRKPNGQEIFIRDGRPDHLLLDKKPDQVAGNDLFLKPGQPLVVLGANGGGKSCLEAMALNALMTPVWTAAAEARVPQRVRLETAADITETEGVYGLHWARGQGKSSFMVEIEKFIGGLSSTRFNEGTFRVWDEFWRKTDQLNGMALMMLAETLIGINGEFSFQASHINPINRIAGPLLRKLGIKVNWATMENFQLKPVGENTRVVSRAFEAAIKFLPKEVGRIWARIHRAKSAGLAFGEKYKEWSDWELNLERLQQLGWLENGRQLTRSPNGFWAWILACLTNNNTCFGA